MTATRPWARAAAGALTATVVALSGACSGDDETKPPSSPPAASSSPPAPGPVTTTVTIGKVSGSRLPRKRRAALQRQVTPVVDAWFDGAYVEGPWPRTGVRKGFAGFTAGARREARRDLRVMSNADIGDRITGVSAKRRLVTLDVLAVKRRSVAVTARIRLRFVTTGEITRDETVRGRLFLTRGKRGSWRVFGYDVSSSDRVSDGAGKGPGKGRGKSRGTNR